jgi:hypothetical protein
METNISEEYAASTFRVASCFLYVNINLSEEYLRGRDDPDDVSSIFLPSACIQ